MYTSSELNVHRVGNYTYKLQNPNSYICYAVNSSCYDNILNDSKITKGISLNELYSNQKYKKYFIYPNLLYPDVAVNDNSRFCNKMEKTRSVCINLKRRTDRKERINGLFKENGIDNYEFFEAIDGKQLTLNDEIEKLFEGNDFGWRSTFIGCALSHYNLWKQFINDVEYDYYLIYEDDIEFCNYYNDKLNIVMNNLDVNEDWDIVFLGQSVVQEYKHEYINKDYNGLSFQKINPVKTIGGIFGYIINKKGAKKLINYIENNGIRHGIDYIMMRMNILNIYEAVPHLVRTDYVTNENYNFIDSDIQKDFTRLK